MQIDEARHLEESAIEGYALRSLPDDAIPGIEQHLLFCEMCRDRVTQADAYIRAMKSATELLPAEPERSRWRLRFLVPAFAACALVIAGVGLFIAPLGRDGSPAPVALLVMRGADIQAHGPAGRKLQLQPDLEGLPAAPVYRMELVDAAGSPVWKGNLAALGRSASAVVPSQPRGVYFVRLSLPTGQLLREFALQLGKGK
jgi:hypothetical protein